MKVFIFKYIYKSLQNSVSTNVINNVNPGIVDELLDGCGSGIPDVFVVVMVLELGLWVLEVVLEYGLSDVWCVIEVVSFGPTEELPVVGNMFVVLTDWVILLGVAVVPIGVVIFFGSADVLSDIYFVVAVCSVVLLGRIVGEVLKVPFVGVVDFGVEKLDVECIWVVLNILDVDVLFFEVEEKDAVDVFSVTDDNIELGLVNTVGLFVEVSFFGFADELFDTEFVVIVWCVVRFGLSVTLVVITSGVENVGSVGEEIGIVEVLSFVRREDAEEDEVGIVDVFKGTFVEDVTVVERVVVLFLWWWWWRMLSSGITTVSSTGCISVTFLIPFENSIILQLMIVTFFPFISQ